MSLRGDIRDLVEGWRWTRRPLAPRSAEPYVEPRDRRDFPTEWARSRPARAVREFAQRYVLKPLVWTEVAPQVHGLDRLEEIDGPVIFVSNHSSHLDTPLILCSLPAEVRRCTAVAAAADYFFDAWWRAAGTALIFSTVPVDRGSGKVSALPGELLDDGWNLLVFPEGTRSPDGWMQRFRRGTAWLCVRHGVPAVPVAIRGAHAAMPRGRSWPKAGRLPVSVRYGRPVHPEEGERFPAFNKRLEQAVARLLDEDQTTWWESLQRAADGGTPSARGPEVAEWRRIWEGSRPLQRSDDRRAWRS
jgi:1-acyl-sn-glycerol-3-phosphate acyltransferase